MNKLKLTGLIAATHTPFHADGSLSLGAVEAQAAHLLRNGINYAFICGSTGESQSMNADERRQVAERWVEVARGTPMNIIVHVGTNCLPDAQALAAHAGKLGAAAISAIAPYYFKSRNLDALVDWCAAIAGYAPETPFYFYDIPSLTNTNFSMPAFLPLAANRIPTFNGVKFSGSDLFAYQLCLMEQNGAFDMPWGPDEAMLAAFALGGKVALGSTYNIAAPVFHRLLAALARGDVAGAQEQQRVATRLINLLIGYGYMPASKLIMKWLGVDVGVCRLPIASLSAEQTVTLRRELEQCGFFQWCQFSDAERQAIAPKISA